MAGTNDPGGQDMTDAIRPEGEPSGGHDPWAPPESGPSLDKGPHAGEDELEEGLVHVSS